MTGHGGKLDLATLSGNGRADLAHLFAGLHGTGPVHRATFHGVDMWLVTGFDETRRLLADPRFSSDERHANADARSSPFLVHPHDTGLPPMMPFVDPPDHTRLRRLVSKVFTPARVQALRPAVQAIADQLLDTMATRDHGDLLDDFAFPLAVSVIMRLVGVPDERGDDFRRWSALFATGDPNEMALVPAAIGEMLAYLGDLVAAKRGGADDDLLGNLAAADDEGRRLGDAELVTMAFVLISAGQETTMSFIGNAMLLLMDEPDLLTALRADPGRIDAAVEELLRVDSSGPMTSLRFVVEDVDLGGVRLRAGDVVAVLLAAANQDPRRFPRTSRIDLDGTDPAHIAFGAGVHFCLGAPLARLEAQIALRGLLARFTDIALAVPRSELAYKQTLFIRGLVRLPITYGLR